MLIISLLCGLGYVLTPLTKKVHQIESIDQPSKATGFVLPWTPIEYVVDACGMCAVDEGTDGRSKLSLSEIAMAFDSQVRS